MPQAFDNCVSQKGKVTTLSGPNKEQGLKKGEYVHYCLLNGTSYRGYIKTKQKTRYSK